jgi:hypothetical protein
MSLGFLGAHDFKATRMGFLNFQGIIFVPNMKLLSCDFLFQATRNAILLFENSLKNICTIMDIFGN